MKRYRIVLRILAGLIALTGVSAGGCGTKGESSLTIDGDTTFVSAQVFVNGIQLRGARVCTSSEPRVVLSGAVVHGARGAIGDTLVAGGGAYACGLGIERSYARSFQVRILCPGRDTIRLECAAHEYGFLWVDCQRGFVVESHSGTF